MRRYLVKPFAFATFADKLERCASYRARIDDAAEPGQAEVDALIGTRRGSSTRALPKRLKAKTLDHVRSALRDADEPLTASEVAGRCGLSRVTARRYLEHLAVEGLVELSMRYGATGRPEHLYAWPRWRRADQAHVLRTAEGLPELLERDAWPSSVALA